MQGHRFIHLRGPRSHCYDENAKVLINLRKSNLTLWKYGQ